MITKIFNFSAFAKAMADKQFSILGLKFSGNEILKHPLFAGSAIMIIGTNLANFFAYIYHLIVGRILGPASYGELATIISVLGFLGITFGFIGLSVVKFVSASPKAKAANVISWFYRKSLIIGIFSSLLLLASTHYLSDFLHIESKDLFLVSPIFLFSLLGFVLVSSLQGLTKFKEIVLSTNLSMFSRIVFGVVLIYLGFGVFGAVVGILFASALGFLVTRYFLKGLRLSQGRKSFVHAKKVLKFTIPVFVNSLASNLLLTMDLVLVKHFFDSHRAGIYASVSTLGKVIFWAGTPVSSVMFPMVSERHAKGQSHTKIFLLSLIFTLGISLFVLFIYFLLPELSIRVLYGKDFLEGTDKLFAYGLFITLFTLSSFLINYFLSKDNTKVVILGLLASVIQGVGIWLFHNSLITVIKVSIFSVSLLLLSLIIYFGYEFGKSSRTK